MNRKILIFSLFLMFLSVMLIKTHRGEDNFLKGEGDMTVYSGKNKNIYSNGLKDEKSPYLLQHAHNPVNWYPWGEEAFLKAKEENKPIFLSIGYSTCHWCHVMAHESFENEEIAHILNKYFISIKVDREERPDIDQIYMKVVMAMTGSGGWPLTVFLTPDRMPFYGGTYFPPQAKWGRKGLKEILLDIQKMWELQEDHVLKTSQTIVTAFQENISKNISSESKDLSYQDVLGEAFGDYKQQYDPQYGGFSSAPKFPSSYNLSFLLRYWDRTGDPKSLEMVEKTLTQMARGGMYDQIGGGFHRYSTDEKWHVPHFEKMLYDQALLSKTYVEAFQATGKEEYAVIAREIFDYVLENLFNVDGGFFSAEDADSMPLQIGDFFQNEHKKEGAFYVWDKEELDAVLGVEASAVFNYYYGVQEKGNAENDPHGEFIHKNVLYVSKDLKSTADQFKKTQQEVVDILRISKEKLKQYRSKRPHPQLDDKVLVDWNGLMISSFAYGARVLGEERYQEAAEVSVNFILDNLFRKDGRLLHRYREGEVGILGNLDDYAFFIYGLLDVYETTFDAFYLTEAKRLTEDMLRLFGDDKGGSFFFVGVDAEKILFRNKEIYDSAIPSGNSIAAINLLKLGRQVSDSTWESRAEEILQSFSREMVSSPMGFGQSLIAVDFGLGPSSEIIFVGSKDSEIINDMLRRLYSHFIPRKVVIYKSTDKNESADILNAVPFVRNQVRLNDQPTVYVCENYVCHKPTNDVEEFEKLLLEKSRK